MASCPLTVAAACILGLSAFAARLVAAEDDLPEAAARTLDPRSLRCVYLDLVGRPPFDAERARWTGRPSAALVDELSGTVECWANWWEATLYYFLLVDNFRPGTASMESVPEELAAGRLGVRDALARIVLSPSFDRRNPGPDTFVSVVMEQLLGLTVQRTTRELERGKRLYDGSEAVFLGERGRSQADVLRIALEDPRMLRHLLEREYERVLRRAPARDDLDAWTRELEKDPLAFPSILRGWFASEAYAERLAERRPEPNRLFVRALFVDLLGRLPDGDEERRLQSALDGLGDPGPLRSVLARLLIDSGRARIESADAIDDPKGWITTTFERFLGRAPTERESTLFLAAYSEPACRPETIVHAIVSCPEYQTW
jgi:hypothetical protein